MKPKTILTTMITVLLIATLVTAEVPMLINYQGNLTESDGTPSDGVFIIKFNIYNAPTGGDVLWNSEIQEVIVTNGLFEVMLGASDMPALPDNLFSADSIRYLGITVGTDPEISPRIRFTSVAYAYQSVRSDSAGFATTAKVALSVEVDVIGTSEIIDGSITDSDISNSAAINVSKITGTAVNLSSDQQITGLKSFGNVLPLADYQVRIGQDFNTELNRYGLYSYLTNSGTGDLYGVYGYTESTTPNSGGKNYGVYGSSRSDASARIGVYGFSRLKATTGTTGFSYGVYGRAWDGFDSYGIYGSSFFSEAVNKYAGYFEGDVHVTGSLSRGGGGFRIDHPLNPENKYLQHSFVESPDMMNIYNGNVVTDAGGYATVTLPDYFVEVNSDYRYQLTVIGEFAQAIVSDEITGNHFTIQTDKPAVKVSWMVTGIRKDKWAEAHRIEVEMNKPEHEQGYYMHFEEWNQPMEKAIDREQLLEGKKMREEQAMQ